MTLCSVGQGSQDSEHHLAALGVSVPALVGLQVNLD
jgi:hypothetical protein